MFDITGKTKRSKWQSYVDSGISAEEAEKKYVEKFNALKASNGLKA